MANYELYRQDVIDTALAQVGKVCGKSSEYAKELDAVKFYNYPKDGAANSCKIFVDDMIYRNIKPQTANNARDAVCEPNKDNCGAGCTQAVGYFKAAGRWYEPFNSKGGCNGCKGDEIFFKKSNGAIYHTGLVVDWDSKGLYVVEGNTSYEGKSGMVAKKFYSYSDGKIAGFGRPKYSEDKPKEEEKTDTQPKPVEPEKPEKSIDDYAKEVIAGKWGNNPERAKKMKAAGIDYDAVQARVNEILGVGKASSDTKVVRVNSWLNVRNAPNGKVIGKLYNNDKVKVFETKDGWARIGNGEWVFADYLH